MTNSNHLPPLPPGYSYSKKLAEGGQGSIWIVLNANMGTPGRQEICKILMNVSAKHYQRFCREIQTLATLSHPGIVTIYYANPEQHYFIMEYLRGGTLRTRCKEGRMTLKQVLECFLSLTETIQLAHSKGLVHRDLKPENILFTETGVPKVADFGISKLKHTDVNITNTTVSPGTPMFMAPEQWTEPKLLDHRSDIWALGIMLFEAATGKVPWSGPIHYIMHNTINTQLPRFQEIRTNLSPLARSIESICIKALQKDLSQRYQSSYEMGQDIKKILAMGLGDEALQFSTSPANFSIKNDVTLQEDTAPTLSMGMDLKPLEEDAPFSLKEDVALSLKEDTPLSPKEDAALSLKEDAPLSLQEDASPKEAPLSLKGDSPQKPSAAPVALDFAESPVAPKSENFAELGFADEEEPVMLEAAEPVNTTPSSVANTQTKPLPPLTPKNPTQPRKIGVQKSLGATQKVPKQALVTTQKVAVQRRSNVTQRMPTQKPLPTNNYMMLGISTVIAVVMMFIFVVFSKPSLASMEKKLRSNDYDQQEKALIQIYERGDEAFPLLFIALDSKNQNIRQEAKDMISSRGNEYLFEISDIVKNREGNYSEVAQIGAIDILKDIKAKEQLRDLSNLTTISDNTKQRALTALIEVDPDLAKHYYFVDDRWVKENYLVNKGYVKVGEEWKHYSVVFEPVEKQLLENLFIFLDIVGIAKKSGLPSSDIDKIGKEFYTKILSKLKKYNTQKKLDVINTKSKEKDLEDGTINKNLQQRQILALNNLQKILDAFEKTITESNNKNNLDQVEIVFRRMQKANDKALKGLENVKKQLRLRDAQKRMENIYQAFYDTNDLSIQTVVSLAKYFGRESSWNNSIQSYKLAQINIGHVLSKPWPRKIFRRSRLESLNSQIEKDLEEIYRPYSVFVWIDTRFYSKERNEEIKDYIVKHLKRVIKRENYYPVFVYSKRRLEKEKPEKWIECAYKEIKNGTYQPKAKKVSEVGNEVDRLRALCDISYWQKGEKSARWHDVVTSSPYIMPREIEPVETLQERMRTIAIVDFERKLKNWDPDFSRKRKKAKIKKEKKDTFYEQNAVDIVYLKNGSKLEGLIKKQTKKTLVLVTFSQLSRGKTFYVDRTIKKKDIKKVKKLPKKLRKKRLLALKEAKSRKNSEKTGIGKIALATINWDFSKGSGWKYESENFILLSNTPQKFTKEIAFRTEKIFDAFKKYFQVNRNSEEKIKIYVFNSMREYQGVIGGAFANPAFYSPTENHIMAACDLEGYQKDISQLKREHEKYKREIERYESEIKRIRSSIRQQREVIQKQLDKAYREGRIRSKHDYNQRSLAVRKQVNRLNTLLNKAKKQANDARTVIRRVDYHNKRLLYYYIDDMISLMYHESFHGFLKNFLFTQETVDYVPRWLNEGLAQFFESAIVSQNELIIGEMDNYRVKFFRKYLDNKSTVPMAKFLKAGAKDFIVQDKSNLENSNLHYTQSWAVVYYLTTQFNLKQGNFFSSYVENIWRGKDPVKAFEELVEMPIEEFEEKWRKKMIELPIKHVEKKFDRTQMLKVIRK